jgi:hypothetical protein
MPPDSRKFDFFDNFINFLKIVEIFHNFRILGYIIAVNNPYLLLLIVFSYIHNVTP